MDEEQAAELHALRARAYGPDADIHSDSAALARLHELEALSASGSDATAEDAGRVGEAVSTARRAPSGVGGETSETAPAVVAEGTSRSRRPDRRTALLWAVSLVVAALIGAGVSFAVTEIPPGAVAVLEPDPDAPWPGGYGDRGEDSVVFDEFHGLTVVYTPNGAGEEGTYCLFVALSPDSVGGSNIFTAGCAGGAFAPTAAIPVTNSMPEELLDEFPEGSALQFVLQDSRVRVYAESP